MDCGNVRRAWGVVVLAALIVSVAVTPAAQEIIDRVLAVVVGDVITLSDVKAALALGLVDPGDAADPVRGALSKLIDRALVLDEVDHYAPPEPTAEAVERSLRAVQARFQSAQAFDSALARVGLTEAGLRRMLREDLRIRSYLDQRFSTTAAEGRDKLIEEWVVGLRRRAEIVDLYTTTPPAR